MKTIKVEKKIFKFNELSEKAKKKAIERTSELESDMVWDYITEQLHEEVSHRMGEKWGDTFTLDINMGFSQGDYVEIVLKKPSNLYYGGDFIDEDTIKGLLKLAGFTQDQADFLNNNIIAAVWVDLTRTSINHFDFRGVDEDDLNEKSGSVEFMLMMGEMVERFGDFTTWEELLEKIGDIVKDRLINLNSDLYSMARETYFSFDDNYYSEMLESNGDYFEADGTFYCYGYEMEQENETATT